jgi:hypothetical protein
MMLDRLYNQRILSPLFTGLFLFAAAFWLLLKKGERKKYQVFNPEFGEGTGH